MDFIHRIERTNISEVKRVPREPAIRLYPEFTGGTNVGVWRWNLQVRGPAVRANGSEGAAFIVATAACSAEDLRALRSAIDTMLETVEHHAADAPVDLEPRAAPPTI